MRIFKWITLHLCDIPKKRKELEQAQDRLSKKREEVEQEQTRLSNYLHSSKEGEMLYILLLATMPEKAQAIRKVLDILDRVILETMTRRDALKLELLTYGKGET